LTGQPGASPTYTDLAIEAMAAVEAIYGLAGHQTQSPEFGGNSVLPLQDDLRRPVAKSPD